MLYAYYMHTLSMLLCVYVYSLDLDASNIRYLYNVWCRCVAKHKDITHKLMTVSV